MDRSFRESATEDFPRLTDRGDHARIVHGEQFRRPERFGVAPERPLLLPTGREVVHAGPLHGGVDRLAVFRSFGEKLLRVGLLSEPAGGIGGAEHSAEVPEIVTDDVVFAVVEAFAVGEGVGQQADEGRIGRRFAAFFHRPAGRPEHGRIDLLQPCPIVGDFGVLPKRPLSLAVGVELVVLRFHLAVGLLVAEGIP